MDKRTDRSHDEPDRSHDEQKDTDAFPVGIIGLPNATRPAVAEVPPGGSFDLTIHPVSKRIGDATFRMLSYNGSIPGPTLRVKQGSEILVNVTNETEMDTTVHWHGLRLENRYDGVPHDTQAPIPPGGRYRHRLTFPDAGLFWYHPHMREDYAQEMGLYGNIMVDPEDHSYWPPVDREVILTLDDILIEGGEIAPFDPHLATFAAMGRFGNVLLIGGETVQEYEIQRGQVVRLSLTNTANTRVFKVALPGARMKLVGSDGGRYEREEWVEDVVIAPSERALVDVLFDAAGTFTLQHVTPERTYQLATLTVSDSSTELGLSDAFDDLRVNGDMVEAHESAKRYLDGPPDKTLALVAEMDFEEPASGETVIYACPMHSEVVRDEPGTCPKCGMKLMPQTAQTTYACPMHPEVVNSEPGHCPQCGMKLMPRPVAYACPMHPEVVSDQPGHCPTCGMKLMPSPAVPAAAEGQASSHEHHDHGEAMAEGIEWEDMMVEVNRETTSANTRWKLIDKGSGKENADIDWTFMQGDQVKIRLVNEMESDHPMHHPFHIHGERFLVLARNDVPEANVVWKDTVLLRTGDVVDILMDASNPGLWMAHCHIAEHMESGMMFNFRVQSSV
jgi:FtsP/CotA-like multicopper oxidase with cupredoxin domain